MLKTVYLILINAVLFGSSASLRCYFRTAETSRTNGEVITCSSSQSTCFSYTFGWGSFAGCGDCSKNWLSSCRTCSTDHCNSLRNSISCYNLEYGNDEKSRVKGQLCYTKLLPVHL